MYIYMFFASFSQLITAVSGLLLATSQGGCLCSNHNFQQSNSLCHERNELFLVDLPEDSSP